MRRVVRESLDAATAADLDRRQTEADSHRLAGQLDVAVSWKSARQSVAFRPVLATLKRMAGDTERCMYCLDSHGTDVEHFWPKSEYPNRMFVWPNLLLGCTECGRLKGKLLPLAADGTPLLVDPTAEDPWDHLDFDSDTGNLTASFDAETGVRSLKGRATVDLLELDRREVLQRLYLRTFRRLCEAVIAATASGAPSGGALIARLRDLDDHGLLGWCFSDRGARHPTFAKLRTDFPSIWSEGVAAFATTRAT